MRFAQLLRYGRILKERGMTWRMRHWMLRAYRDGWKEGFNSAIAKIGREKILAEHPHFFDEEIE